MDLQALKRAATQLQANRKHHLLPALIRLKSAVRTTKRSLMDDKEILRLSKRLASEREAHLDAICQIEFLQHVIETLKQEASEKLSEIRDNTEVLVKDRQAKKRLRSKRAKETSRPRGPAGEEGDWEKYEVCRSMDKYIEKAKKEGRRLTQAQAAAKVIKAYNTERRRIEADVDTLCRYYRNWKKRKAD